MTREEMREKLADPRWYIERFLKIRTKDGQLINFKLNKAQLRLYEALQEQDRKGKPMRVIILKARQLGFSTLAEALIFHESATNYYRRGLVVAHREDSTANLFKMSRRYLDNLPASLKPMTKASNAREILFENPDKNEKRRAQNPGFGSSLRCQTAGGGGIGRSDTLQMVHASEFAFWPGDKKETFVGIMQAVPSKQGTMVIVESTANGFDEFHEMWEAAVNGESDFLPMFFPWFEMDEYRKPADPGVTWTAEELELKERYDLDDEQLSWRRWCIRNNCGGDERMFRQEYPSYPEEAFLTSGNAVFDQDLIAQRQQDAPDPKHIGQFTYKTDPENPARIWDIQWQEREDGCIRIYSDPKQNEPYVIGGDTAGTGSDWFTGQVIDNISGRQVAVLRHQYDEDLYARQMYCLGRHYGWGLIGVEVNYSTYPVKMLELMRYPRLYLRQIPDTYKMKFREAYGWETNSRTRPLAIAEFVQRFRDDPEMINDRQTLGEMRTFQYNDDHRPEAIAGEHDDLVMAMAIANAIRGQQNMTVPERRREMRGWSKGMIADYRRASPEARKYMIEQYGRPSDE